MDKYLTPGNLEGKKGTEKGAQSAWNIFLCKKADMQRMMGHVKRTQILAQRFSNWKKTGKFVHEY